MSSFEIPPPLGEDGGTTFSSPTTQQLSQSEVTTPRMSSLPHDANRALTPPQNDNNGSGGMMNREFSYSSVLLDTKEQLLEPPAWHAPSQEEIEYTDAWNNVYSNQSHFLCPLPVKDDSTIGSTQTNNSMYAHCGTSLSSRGGGLRPRGFSICSNNDSIEITSQTQPSHRRHPSLPGSTSKSQSGHRRHPSLPQNIFSSQPTTQHQLLPPTIVSTTVSSNQKQQQQQPYLQQSPPQHETNNAAKPKEHDVITLLQSSTQHTPYEIHSSHHASQVKADAALAGLQGSLVDLYTVDRLVDTATTRMLATNEKHASPDRKENDVRRTAMGTLHDIQSILELYRVDKMADRFKVDLQMPLFMEEEAWVHSVYKDLRKIDLEMELYTRKNNGTERKVAQTTPGERQHNGSEQEDEYHFDLSDTDDEGLGGEDIYMSAEAFLTDDEAYHFVDPHEVSMIHSNKYHSSEVSASIHDNLSDVIELLKTDVEIDGASSRQKGIEMIRPLLETDQEINKWKERTALNEMWTDDLKALYAVDVEVGRAKTRISSNQAKSSVPDNTNTDVGGERSSDDVKAALARHIPNVSQPYCPTSPEPRTRLNVSAPPLPPPLSLPTGSTSAPAPTQRKRSIFTQKEKASVAKNAQLGGVMMPGTTTVVMTKGGEMIDDIPIGRVKFPGV